MTALALHSYAKVQSIEIDGKEDVITLRPVVKSNLFNSLIKGDDYASRPLSTARPSPLRLLLMIKGQT